MVGPFICFRHADMCTTGAAARGPAGPRRAQASASTNGSSDVRFPNPEATPELSWILQVWFCDPSSRHVELVAVAELPVFDSGKIVLIPQAGELQVGQAVRIVPETHFVQLDEGNRRLEVLIAELRIRLLPEWAAPGVDENKRTCHGHVSQRISVQSHTVLR